MSLRIALLSYRSKPHCGGQGVYVRHLSRELVALGHEVEVFSGQPYPELDPGVRLSEVPSLDLYREPDPFRVPRPGEFRDLVDVEEFLTMCTAGFPEPKTFGTRVVRLLRDRLADFDVVHDNQVLATGMLAIEGLGLPLVTTIHHPITVDRRLELEHAATRYKRLTLRRWYSFTNMQTRVARRLQRVITVSANSLADIHRDHEVPLDRMQVVPVGVDPELFRPVDTVERQPGRIITTASADVTMKGLRYLLEALAKLRTERDLKLTVIGRPKEGGASARAIAELGLTDAVEFVSGVSDERIVELYSAAELAVVPSLYEGFSLPAIEAMSCGVPLVATTGGAIPEVVGADGDTALLVEPGDSQALAAKMAVALDDPALRARVGSAGRQRVIDHWSWRHTAAKTVEQYRARLDQV
jgi:glycosyltransferase involved in cell wall biosynthesis